MVALLSSAPPPTQSDRESTEHIIARKDNFLQQSSNIFLIFFNKYESLYRVNIPTITYRSFG